MINQIIGITLFVIWTAIVYMWSIRSCGGIIKEQDKVLKQLTNKLDEMDERLRLRINQNDTLLQTIDILNKQIQEVKNDSK